jgi:hypothetical protein
MIDRRCMRALQLKECKNYKYLRDTVTSMRLIEKYKEKRVKNAKVGVNSNRGTGTGNAG